MKVTMKNIYTHIDRFFDRDFVQKTTDYFATQKGFWLIFALIVFTYAFRLEVHPGYHGDESSLLYMPYRAAEFGDYRYPLIFSDSHNAGELRHYPPVMAMSLRSMVHQAFGFSAYGSRVLSAVMMGLIALLFGRVVLRWTEGNWRMASAALFVAGLNPAMIVAARTVRFEQEIVFMGSLALLLPFLLLRSKQKALNMLVWVFSGLCAAWAGMSHPWGLVFPMVLVLSFLFYHKPWRETDGLHGVGRIFLFGIGCLPPMAVTLMQVMQNWPEFLTYVQDVSSFYEHREEKVIQYFLNRYFIPLEPGIFGRIVASVLQLHMSGYGATATKLGGISLPMGIFFQIVFWGFVVGLFMTAKKMLAEAKTAANLPFVLLPFVALVFIVFSLFYMPNQVYAIYLGLFVVFSAVMRAVRSADFMRGVRVYALLCAVFVAAYMIFLVAMPSVRSNLPMDERFEALADMTEEMNLEHRTAYVDSTTWHAAGKDTLGLVDIFRTGKAENNSYMVATADTFHAYAIQFPDNKDTPWSKAVEAYFHNHVLRGVIAIDHQNTGYYYFSPMQVDDPLLVTYFDKKNTRKKFRGSYKDIIHPYPGMRPGWYLLMTLPNQPEDFKVWRKTEGVKVHYARKSGAITGVALIELKKPLPEGEYGGALMVMPLLKGWKN